MFEDWLRRYGEAWESQDADEAAALFTAEAKYYETPFDPPMNGRAAVHNYWKQGTGAQREIRFVYDVLAVEQDSGLAHWTSSFQRVPSGNCVKLDGILNAKFDPDGQCWEFREWWHRDEQPLKDQPAEEG
jgi:hypothetical protein